MNASPSSALERARERYLAGAPVADPGQLVAIVGASVPAEVVLAAGLMPVRLRGQPRPTPKADRYGLQNLDPPVQAAFEQLLDGSEQFGHVLIGSDLAAHAHLFQALREIQRVEPVAGLPPFAFVDMLHLPYRTTARYDRGQVERLVETAHEWSGVQVDVERLRAAITETNATRSLLAEAMGLRQVSPALLTGCEALAVAGAALVSPPQEIQPWLAQLVSETEKLAEHEGTRVYVTGSQHEDTLVYELIESCGCVIVGEDHVSGQDALGETIAVPGDPIESLVEHYQFANLPAHRLSAERAGHVVRGARQANADAVVIYTAAHDRATPWDAPAIAAAVGEARLPLIRLPEHRHGDRDMTALAQALNHGLEDMRVAS